MVLKVLMDLLVRLVLRDLLAQLVVLVFKVLLVLEPKGHKENKEHPVVILLLLGHV